MTVVALNLSDSLEEVAADGPWDDSLPEVEGDPVSGLEFHEVSNIFPLMQGKEFDNLVDDIRTNGLREPIVTYRGKVLDGRNRLMACQRLGIGYESREYDGDDPLSFVVSINLHRRHLTQSQLACVADEIANMKHGGDRRSNQSLSGDFDISQRKAAEMVGAGRATVARVSRVKKHGPEELYKSIKSGETTAVEAEKELRLEKEYKEEANGSAKSKGRPVFNLTNNNIEWAKWTWNPVTGCKNGCSYCYARDIAMRFERTFEPRFREERLRAPYNTSIRVSKTDVPGIHNVFVCSMADLFGDWVPKEQIQQILDVCRDTPQWRYIFLTKNPKRYAEFNFPDNSWAGATVDTQDRVEDAHLGLNGCDAPVLFISCEPLKGPIEFPDDMPIHWLIVGGQSKTSGEPAFQPEWGWVESLVQQARRIEVPIYFKPNLTVRPKEYPQAK